MIFILLFIAVAIFAGCAASEWAGRDYIYSIWDPKEYFTASRIAYFAGWITLAIFMVLYALARSGGVL